MTSWQHYVVIGLLIAQAVLVYVLAQLPSLDTPEIVGVVLGALSVGITAAVNQLKPIGKEA